MTAPLTRDQQIEMMRTAQARQEARMAVHLAQPAIRETLGRPAPGQKAGGFSQRTLRVACCG